MLFFSLISFCGTQSFKCGDHHILDQESLLLAGPSEIFSLSEKGRKKIREPIRVHFDYDFLDGDDPFRCTKVGQLVTWDNYRNLVCTKEDIMTDAKKKNIVGTFENLKKYLNRLLKVYPLESLSPLGQPGIPINETTRYDTDLYVSLQGRPFADGVGASAGSFASTSFDDPKPKVGFIAVNLLVFTDIQDVSSKDRKAFEIALHEICHILFSYEDHWINPKTGKTYSESKVPFPDKICLNEKKHEFFIRYHPYLNKFAADRFGNTEMDENGVYYFDKKTGCPAGIELEDDGGPGTRLAHFEMRVYPQELMVGVNNGYGMIISNVTLSFLQATGFYDVDFSMAEPLTYGTKYTNDNKPIPNFAIATPRSAVGGWPDRYQCKFPSMEIPSDHPCTPDLKGRGMCDKHIYKCPGETCCSDIEFHDPQNTGYVGVNEFMDFTLAPILQSPCTHPSEYFAEEIKQGGTYGPNAMCFSTNLNTEFDKYPLFGHCHTIDCSKKGSVFVKVSNLTVECTKKGQEITFPGIFYGKLICPDPTSICTNFREIKWPNYTKIFSDDHDEDPSKTVETDEKPSKTKEIQTKTEDKTNENRTEKDMEEDPSENDGGNHSNEKPEKNKSKVVAIAVSTVVVAIIAIVVVCVIIYLKKKKKFGDKDCEKSELVLSL